MEDNINSIDTGVEDFEMGPDIMTLLDEDGAEHSFEILDSAEFEGKNYMALVPVPEQPEDVLEDTGELVILRMGEEDGEEFLEAIEDETEFDKVGAFFIDRLSDTFDFED